MSKAESINSVAKACRLLKEGADMGVFGLSEMARALDEPISSVDRLVATLAAEGMLERIGPKWRIGKAAASIWSSYCLTLQQTISRARRDLRDVHINGAEAIEWQ
ncbi:MAG: helix-turn-helix domain-containing protein [Pseudomonadota bacterium]